MKIAHLILTHKNPQQLERLVNALQHEGFDFFIHVDAKTPIEPFLYLKQRKDVFFIQNRTKIYWAGFGTIQATLNGFEEILPLNYDYVNVISGQDFPVKPAHAIYNYFRERKGKEFITCEEIDSEHWNVGPRVRNYHLINWRIPGKFKLEKILNKILPPRKFPVNHHWVGRANWFTLSTAAIRYALDFLRENPKVIRYYKYCWGADEFIFSTILYNSHFKERIVDNVVYVDWTGPKLGHPKMLGSEDFDKLIQSDKLFARKMDMDTDGALFDLLEKHNGVLSKTTPA